MGKNYVTPKRQAEIDELLAQIQLTTGKAYPEDSVIDIIKAYIPNVAVVEHDFFGDKHTRGAVYKESAAYKKPLIVVQKKQTKEAKTFTLAHEFGHYSLGHVGSANFLIDNKAYDGSPTMQKEAEAQYFAASLLMPQEEFIPLMDIMSTKELAKRFGVSESAAKVRKAWLDGRLRREAAL